MRYLSFALFFAALVASIPAGAQEAPAEMISAEGPHTLCVLHAPEADEVFTGVNELRDSAALRSAGPASATFEVTYNGFPAAAETAFQYAVDIWATHIESSVTIRVDASYTALGSNVLGSARANRVYGGAAFPIPGTFYPDALADAILGSDANGTPNQPDIIANFSSNFSSWYFGTDGNTPANRVDFVSVVLHELGHGLGFFGSANYDNGSGAQECNGVSGTGCYGLVSGGSRIPVVFDRFVEDPLGVSILDTSQYPNVSQTLGDLLRSEDLFFDSPTTFEVYGNSRPPIYAPAGWEAGSSYSHWDETVIPTGNANALMTPRLAFGESFPDPGPLTCALMSDIGWPLGLGCSNLVVDDENGPLANGLSIERTGPNPFTSSTALRVRLDEPQTLRATLMDALGREVETLYDGEAVGRVTLTVGGNLAPGVYIVRVQTESGTLAERLVRAQ